MTVRTFGNTRVTLTAVKERQLATRAEWYPVFLTHGYSFSTTRQ
ncbi:MAG TPA: hypothetical protein VMC42_09025 [Methanoregulaceae archaeon]|nr:hypothetical protein [Methanoregulaceae archaeon]